MNTAILCLKKVASCLWSIVWQLLCAWARLNGYNLKHSDTVIDPAIAPLVAAMNESGRMQTIDSCGGHIGKCFAPYVSFRASVSTAKELSELLDKLPYGPKESLSSPWIVIGVFKQEGLVFRLCSPLYQVATMRIVSTIFHLGIRRRYVDGDIATIASLIQKRMCFASTVGIHNVDRDEQTHCG